MYINTGVDLARWRAGIAHSGRGVITYIVYYVGHAVIFHTTGGKMWAGASVNWRAAKSTWAGAGTRQTATLWYLGGLGRPLGQEGEHDK